MCVCVCEYTKHGAMWKTCVSEIRGFVCADNICFIQIFISSNINDKLLLGICFWIILYLRGAHKKTAWKMAGSARASRDILMPDEIGCFPMGNVKLSLSLS